MFGGLNLNQVWPSKGPFFQNQNGRPVNLFQNGQMASSPQTSHPSSTNRESESPHSSPDSAVQKGLEASRSKLNWFRHNDMEHLEELLKKQAAEDKKNPKKAAVTRRFLVVEGLYNNYGDFCPLKKLVELKYKYKVRIFIDETYSFAAVGRTGRGVTELFDVDIKDIDMIAGSLETSLASTGGFCIGTTYVVDHQRLSGHGYCFSASLPPLLAVAAQKGLELMDNQPELFDRLQQRSIELHNLLSK